MPLFKVEIPAESYPLYSSFFKASTILDDTDLLLTIPTIGYLLIVPDLFDAITNEGGDAEIGWGVYILVPFWLFTIILNIFTIFSEAKKSSKSK